MSLESIIYRSLTIHQLSELIPAIPQRDHSLFYTSSMAAQGLKDGYRELLVLAGGFVEVAECAGDMVMLPMW